MALKEDRHTYMREGREVSIPVKAGAVIFAGGMVAVDATGFAVPGAESADLTYAGRAEAQVDNRGGADGALSVLVARGRQFQWANSATDPVTQARVGKVCYIEDDETVSASSNAEARSEAGVVMGVETDGIWVE